jgi:diguanylate cyclase
VFWKKRSGAESGPDASGETDPSGQTETTTPAGAAPYADAALDTVVGILRALGRYAFDITGVDAFRRQCEAWAEHLAIGGPHPDTLTGRAAASTEPPRSPGRDWVGARHFVLRRRQDESAYIARSVGDLREVIADLTERLAVTLVDDQETDRSVGEQVTRLRAATETTSLDLLKREVLTVADLLARLVEQRGQRVRTQIMELDLKIAALSEELHEVKHESSLDGLTRVFNRSAFDKTFLRLHRIGALSAQPSCIMMTDLDNLKQINDQYGHRCGDEALRVFADYLVRSFPRRSDFIARYGGDELVVILPQTRLNQSQRLAMRFLDGVRAVPVHCNGATFTMTASIGLAELKRGEEADSWLERADKALYAAKTNGRDRLVVAP